MKKKKILISGISLGCLLIVVVAASVLFVKMKSSQKSKEVINTVINQIFTCPNQDMIDLCDNAANAAINKSDTLPLDTVVQLDSTEMDKKLKVMYAPYISNDWYPSFVNHFWNRFAIYSTVAGYETKVDHIVLSQSKTIPSNYSFTVYLKCGKSNSTKEDLQIEGSAQISEKDGKISYLQIFDKVLTTKLREMKVAR